MAPSPSGSQGRGRRGKRAAVEEDCRSRRLDRAKPSQARSRLRCYLESTPAVNLPSRAHWLGRGGFFWRSLIEARQYVPSTQWQKWCRKWVKRSLRDIQKLMKMASAEDPEEALERVRAEARESMAQTRRNASNVGRIITEIMKPALDEKRALLAHLQKEISDAEASVAKEPQDFPSVRGQGRDNRHLTPFLELQIPRPFRLAGTPIR
jgi:hypothetical protein